MLRWGVGKRGLVTWFYYFVYLALFWSLFRYLVRLPEVIEELWFKPVIWLVPLLFVMASMKKKIVVFGNNWKAIPAGVLMGIFYFVLFKYRIVPSGTMNLDSVGIAFVTAVVEQITFAGVLLPFLIRESKSELAGITVTALAFGLIRIPINLFVYGLRPEVFGGVIMLAVGVQLINGFLRVRLNNTWVAIGAHFGLILAGLS